MLGRWPYLDAQGLLIVVTGLCLAALAAGEEGGAVIPDEANNDFNVPAFAIAVREAMEGCVLGKRPIRVGWGEASTQRNCVHVQVMALPPLLKTTILPLTT